MTAQKKNRAPRGDIANAAEIAKVKQYQARYDIPNGNSIGFAIETSGAWGSAAKRLLWSIAEAVGGPARCRCTTL